MKIAYKYRIYPNKEQQETLMRYMFEYNLIKNIAVDIAKTYAIKEQRKSGKVRVVKGVEYPAYTFPSSFTLQTYLNSLKKESREGLQYISSPKTIQRIDEIKDILIDIPASCTHYIADAVKSAIDKRYQKNAYKGSNHKKPHFITVDGEDVLDTFHINYSRFNPYDCSYTVQQQQQTALKEIDGLFYFTAMKVGNIRMKYHRNIPEGSKFDAVTISRRGDRWFIVLGGLTIKEAPMIDDYSIINSVGIDKNTDNYFVSSDGKEFINPIEKLKKLKKQIKHLQRRNGVNKENCKTFSKRVYNSQNYKKYLLRNAKLNDKISNIKKALLNNASKYIVDNYDAIFVEDLSVKGMQKANGSMVLKNNFYDFDRMLEYKSLLYGKHFEKIDRFYPSSQTCSKCGKIHPEMKNLRRRVFRCECGNILNRDHNAAINIRNEGLKNLKNNIDKENKIS